MVYLSPQDRSDYVIKKITAVILAILVCIPFATGASAASSSWYDDISGGTYKTITSSPFVADTFCGVDAIYDLTSSKYKCNELVNRFYEQAYGLSIFAGLESGPIMYSAGYEFVTPTEPKTGDIVFTTEAMRKPGAGPHWGIVKSYSNGVITLFEQNVVYQGKAGIDRQLRYPSNYYYLYTPVAKAGYPAPEIKNYTGPSAPGTGGQEPADTGNTEGTGGTEPNTDTPAAPDMDTWVQLFSQVLKYAVSFIKIIVTFVTRLINQYN